MKHQQDRVGIEPLLAPFMVGLREHMYVHTQPNNIQHSGAGDGPQSMPCMVPLR